MRQSLLEALENRQLMSVTLDMNTHVLSIIGTNNDDTLSAEIVGQSVVVHDNANTVSYLASNVKKIYVHAQNGDDKIIMDDSIYLPTELHCGTGFNDFNELIQGGYGPDEIFVGSVATVAYGSRGNDIIHGGIETSGLNTLYGEEGNDLFLMDNAGGIVACYGGDGVDTIDFSAETDPLLLCNGSSGEYDFFNGVPVANDVAGYLDAFENFIGGRSNDYIYGNDVANVIKGGAGKDYVVGGKGNDILEGNSESDYLYGGQGNDKLNGGASADRIYGEAGNDIILSKDGYKDIVVGGDGSDTAYVDASDMVSSVEVVVV